MDTITTAHTLHEILAMHAQQIPNQLAYVFLNENGEERERLTYGELDRKARTIATELLHLDPIPKTALLLYSSDLEFLTAFFGCLYAGVIAVPAYPPKFNRHMHRLEAIFQDSQATVALTTAPVCNKAKQHFTEESLLSRLHWMATDTLELRTDEADIRIAAEPNELAFLQYTSGSTGTPKGVMVSHQNLLHNMEYIRQKSSCTTESVCVSWLPLFHDLGLIMGVLTPFYVGFPAVLMAPVTFIQKPYLWLKAISDYRGTMTCSPNFGYELCLSKITEEERETLDLSSLQVALNGAEPIRRSTIDRFCEVFGPVGFQQHAFFPAYGLAEATLLATGNLFAQDVTYMRVNRTALEQHRILEASPEEEDALEVVGCGTAGILDVHIEIVDPQTNSLCEPDVVGEIWISSPSITRGYWNRSEETAKTFHAYTDQDKGPYLRTGDLGFKRGEMLYFTGRIKDLIIVRGRNHYPSDIELTAEQVNPILKVGNGAAFALEVDNEERVVVVYEIKRHHKGVDLAQLVADMREAVASEHELQLHAVVLIREGSIPKTSSGKIQRSACRQEYVSGELKTVYATSGSTAVIEQSDADSDAAQAKMTELKKKLLLQELGQRSDEQMQQLLSNVLDKKQSEDS
ncbi:MAG: fatty acyl-AMP ligase [Tumebacillaceae bacterium]